MKYVITSNGELYHYGVPGMKWGVRRAQRQNAKVDKSFKKWQENDAKKKQAIALGKQSNNAKLTYLSDKKNKEAKDAYKSVNREYKKALSKNTTYRKGAVRQEVGQDASRKYLSEAKKVKKQLDADPTNKQLKKRYKDLSERHDVERAKARKAASVGEKRSRKKAAFKRGLTMTAKSAAATAAIAAGAYAVNTYLSKHDVRLNGKRVGVSKDTLRKTVDYAKKGREFMQYVY